MRQVSGAVVPPIIVAEGWDVQLYPTVSAAAHDLEAIDVSEGVYDFYDSLGTRLLGAVDERLGTVSIMLPPAPTATAEVLAERLRGFVVRVGPEQVEPRETTSAPLPVLIAALASFFKVG